MHSLFNSRHTHHSHHSRLCVIALLLPFWLGCTSIVTTKGKSPTHDKVETTAVEGWNHSSNMRELGKSDFPEQSTLPEELMSKRRGMHGNNANNYADNTADNSQSRENDRDAAANSAENFCPPGMAPFMATPKAQTVANTKIRASGYGAPPRLYVSEPQRRLLAIRAAKLDAMRTLSERVSGIQLWGNTTMSDLALSNERINLYMDSYISGARTLTVTQLDDSSYEVIMELKLNSQFLNNLQINQCVPTRGS